MLFIAATGVVCVRCLVPFNTLLIFKLKKSNRQPAAGGSYTVEVKKKKKRRNKRAAPEKEIIHTKNIMPTTHTHTHNVTKRIAEDKVDEGDEEEEEVEKNRVTD